MKGKEGLPETKPNPETGETPEELRKRAALSQQRAAERMARKPKGKEADLTGDLDALKGGVLEAHGENREGK